MKILADTYVQQLKDENISSEDFKLTKTKLKNLKPSDIKPIFDFLITGLQAERPVQAVVTVNKDVTIKIQSNIINLPIAYATPLQKVVDANADYEINIYAVFEAEKINASHLRIDQIGTADQLLQGDSEVFDNLSDWLKIQFENFDANK